MRYTINRLYKTLGKLVEEGHGKKPVAVNKRSFQHNCEEDGVVILELAGMGIQWVPMADDNGGTKFNKDGSESGKGMLVLAGSAGANMNGELVEIETHG